MFDIGFSELLLVLIVGLVVLGPKRLPIAIRTVMGWVRTIRGLAANVQNELAQELKLQELKDSIKKAEELNLSSLSPELSKTVEELKQSAQQMQANLNTAKEEITKLSDEQVAEIQAKIEAESKSQDAQTAEVKAENVSAENSQETAENAPLVNEESPAEVAENAELDEQLLAEKLSIYYPPDDDEPAPQTVKVDEKEKANGTS